MPEYTSPVPVYVDGVYVVAGQPFTTDAPKGSTWVATGPEPEAAPAPAPSASPADPDQAKRDADISAAFDMLDEFDFVKSGPRAERPKCSAIENLIGYPVFTPEVDALWDKRSA